VVRLGELADAGCLAGRHGPDDVPDAAAIDRCQATGEAPGVVPGVPLDGRDDGTFVLARDGSTALARTDGHGDWVEWLPASP
jgi:hypothetical protein